MMKAVGLSIITLGLLTACASQKKQTTLIQDCPDEKIVNKMPMVQTDDKSTKSNSYYIYKGERRELTEFDEKWLKENCTIEETVVY